MLEEEQISFRSASPTFDGVEDYSHQIAEMIGLRNESNFIQAGVSGNFPGNIHVELLLFHRLCFFFSFV